MNVLETMLMDLYTKEKEAAEASWCKEQVVMVFQELEMEEEKKLFEEKMKKTAQETDAINKAKAINGLLLKRADTTLSNTSVRFQTQQTDENSSSSSLLRHTSVNARASLSSTEAAEQQLLTPSSPQNKKKKLLFKMRRAGLEV